MNVSSTHSQASSPVTVLYIAGSGRSGSTVFDLVLGNHQDVESVGELSNLFRSGWRNGEYCACGQRGDECSFWSEVKKDWVARTNAGDLEEYIKLQGEFEGLSSIPRLLRQRHKPSESFQRYAKWTHALFRSIQNVSGKSTIVDSSKSPARALALSAVHGN